MKNIIAICSVLMAGLKADGQSAALPELVVKTYVMADGVAIRWTPKDLYHWRYWSHGGYRLERYTIGRDGQAVNNGPGVLIGGGPIRPLQGSAWETLLDSFPAAGLVRQCLEGDERGGNYLQQIEAREQCYVFSMLAMQNNFSLAVAAGLGIVDRTVRSDETYLYRLVPVDTVPYAPVGFVIDMRQVTMLPVLPPLNVNAKDQRVVLQWDAERYKDDYWGFRVERSLDSGLSYQILNDIPLVPVRTEDGERPLEMFTDTVVRYDDPILYRIRGIGYFGQPGLPSEPALIRVQYETKSFPSFAEVKSSGANGAEIQWQFDTLQEPYIRGFCLLQAPAVDGPFERSDTNTIPPGARTAFIQTSEMVAYVQVAAITLNGTLNPSLPILVQQEDSVPPEAPEWLSVQVDSNGVAMLKWKKGGESDLLGYKLFRANFRTHEFAVITPGYRRDTVYSDTLFTAMIRDSVYYQLMAFDNRYNESSFSKVWALALPDKVPPSAPYMDEMTVKDGKVFIHWIKSDSRDVKNYLLKRNDLKTGDSQMFPLLAEYDNYCDSMVNTGSSYSYSLFAEDHSGLRSVAARPRMVRIPVIAIMPQVEITMVAQDTVKNCVNIFWDYAYDEEVSHYRILQIMPDGSAQTVGTATGGKNFYSSFYMRPYTLTRYIVIAYFKDGRRSRI